MCNPNVDRSGYSPAEFINVNRGVYRETSRSRVCGTQREPIGAAKLDGPKPNQAPHLHGHIPGTGTWSYIPPQLCGKTRQAMLDEKRDTRKPESMTSVGGGNDVRKKGRGKGKGKKARAIAKSLIRQDAAVAKINARKRLERDRRIARMAQTMLAVREGRLSDAINNRGMEVCNA